MRLKNLKEKIAKTDNVHLELTPNQYRALLELIYCGNWVINSYREGPEVLSEYDDVENMALLQAEGAGFKTASIVDERTGEHYFSPAFEKSIHERFIHEYEDDAFWDGLVQMLTERDMDVLYDKENLKSLSPVQLERLFSKQEQRYWREFEKHGLEHVVLANPASTDDSQRNGVSLSHKVGEA